MTASAAAPIVAAVAGVRGRGSRGRVYLAGLAGLACGVVAALATPSAALGATLLLPALLAWFAERARGRPVARAMLLFGIAGALPSLAALWGGAGDLHAAVDAALNLHNLALAWAAQATGWLLAEGLPIAARLAVAATARRRSRQLRAERARLAEEWSLPGEARLAP